MTNLPPSSPAKTWLMANQDCKTDGVSALQRPSVMIPRVPGVASLLSWFWPSVGQKTAVIQHKCYSGFSYVFTRLLVKPYNTPADKNAVIKLPSQASLSSILIFKGHSIINCFRHEWFLKSWVLLSNRCDGPLLRDEMHYFPLLGNKTRQLTTDRWNH